MRLKIDKLIYGGDGLARGQADERGRGKAVFVPFVLTGEEVEALIVQQKPGFLRAAVPKIVQPSPQRVSPPCEYYGDCGGCQYQHAAYEYQLDIKAAILKETLLRTARLEAPEVQVHASPPWHYRNRARLRVRGGKGFAMGYSRHASHELIAVKECPISSPLINRALAAFWECGRVGQVPENCKEVQFFANAADDQLLLEITSSETGWSAKPEMRHLAAELRGLLPELAGVHCFPQFQTGALDYEKTPRAIADEFGADALSYQAGEFQFRVSAGSFFQTNRFLIEELMKTVTAGAAGGRALDLYAGTGLFAAPLALAFSKVVAVENAEPAVHDLHHNVAAGVEVVHEDTGAYLRRRGAQGTAPIDLAVVDPPRTGLGEKIAAALGTLPISRLTYVSCDPATLARDLKVLVAAGFGIVAMHLIDLFPQTFHIESVTQLAR